MFGYDPDAMLSQHYKLGDFLGTSHSLSQPNMPNEVYQFDNLVLLADMKEQLDHLIGPSQIISGFRTKELQQALASSGEPVATGVSFHEAGRAFDLYPTTMSIDEMFGQILANEDLKNQFSEIAIKPGQNALHLAINVPGDVRAPKVTGLDESGSYVRLSVDQIASYIEPYMESFDDAMATASSLVTYNKAPLYIALAVGLGGALFMILNMGKSHESR